MAEIWKDVPGYEGKYQASTYGRIRSLGRFRVGRYGNLCKISGKMLKFTTMDNGYLAISMHLNSAQKTRLVHQVVLETFVGPCPPGMQTRHFPDADKSNNRLANLEWASHQQNMKDQYEQGTLVKGEASCKAKITEQDVRRIRARANSGESQRSIMKDYPSIGQMQISRIVRREQWKHVK